MVRRPLLAALAVFTALALVLLVEWRGPAPDERGRSLRIERPLDGVLTVELPVGALELALTCAEQAPRRVSRNSLRIPAATGAPPLLSLGP